MALRMRQPRTAEEYQAALGGIGHYFGGGWTARGRRAVRPACCRSSACIAAFDGDAIVAGAGAFPFELSIPGGALAVRGRDGRRRATRRTAAAGSSAG